MKIGSSVSTQEAVVETTGSEIIRQEPSWGSLVCCPKTGYRGKDRQVDPHNRATQA